MVRILQGKLSYSDVLTILLKGNQDFSPTLTSLLDVKLYAKKLSVFADFMLLEEASEFLGCIAYYKNSEGHFIYVSHCWVSHQLQGQGYGALMLRKLREMTPISYYEIRLEVLKTNPAKLFYQKQGFHIKEDRGDKLLLSLKMK